MIIENIGAHYRELLLKHGDTPQATQYSSIESQERRFQILTEIGNLQGKTILDFGCGTGQLGTYLKRVGIDAEYHGVDIVPEFVDLCRKKFTASNFGKIEDFKDHKFDYVIIGGVFNNRMIDNINFYQATIRQLFGMTHIGLSFNMMSAYVDYQDQGLFYEYPENVFRFLKAEVTPYVQLRNDYEVKQGAVPFDFTVYAYQKSQ